MTDIGGNWAVYVVRTDRHVVPVKDLKSHRKYRDCWCRPKLTNAAGGLVGTNHAGPVVVVHNALDGREALEP